MTELDYYKEKCRLLEGALDEIAEHPGNAKANEGTIATTEAEIERLDKPLDIESKNHLA